MKSFILIAAALLLTQAAQAERFIKSDGSEVYIYNSKVVVYQLKSGEALRISKSSSGASYDYKVEAFKDPQLKGKKTSYECQTYSLIRLANSYEVGLDCQEVKGNFKSTNTKIYKIDGKLHNNGTASGTLEIDGNSISFKAYDPNLL